MSDVTEQVVPQVEATKEDIAPTPKVDEPKIEETKKEESVPALPSQEPAPEKAADPLIDVPLVDSEVKAVPEEPQALKESDSPSKRKAEDIAPEPEALTDDIASSKKVRVDTLEASEMKEVRVGEE